MYPALLVRSFPSPEDLPRVVWFLASLEGIDFLTAKELLLSWAKAVGASPGRDEFDLLRRVLP